MPELTAEGRRIVGDVARRHGASEGAVVELLVALVAGGGSQAQFNHPDLGGMGQWSQGGMVMVGDMFNNALKARVDAVCAELAGLVRTAGLFAPAVASGQSQSQGQLGGIGVSVFVPGPLASAEWWPAELGSPASVGAQNELRYAFFPAPRRLAIARSGQVTVYDTGDHRIGGFSQQQSGDQSLTFTSQHGLVRVADLPVVGGSPAAAAPAPAAPTAPAGAYDIFARIERLAELRAKDIRKTPRKTLCGARGRAYRLGSRPACTLPGATRQVRVGVPEAMAPRELFAGWPRQGERHDHT